MNPDRTAARLALRGIFGLHRKGKGWNLYRCGVTQAVKLTLVFSAAEFESIQSTYIGFMTNKQLNLVYNMGVSSGCPEPSPIS